MLAGHNGSGLVGAYRASASASRREAPDAPRQEVRWLAVARPQLRPLGRYWIASATWAGPVSEEPARSAIVRASLRTRWVASRRELKLLGCRLEGPLRCRTSPGPISALQVSRVPAKHALQKTDRWERMSGRLVYLLLATLRRRRESGQMPTRDGPGVANGLCAR